MLSATLLSLAVDESYLNGINYGEQGVKRVMMPDNVVTTYGAVCLDGTAAGFYYSPPSGAGSNASWQIYFEGGGWCYDEQDCLHRTQSDLGSSSSWPETIGTNGILSADCSVNPDFCNFHRVYMKYCDGNSFAGNRDDPLVVQGKPLYFRGRRILQAVLATLKRGFGLGSAKEVLLTGCSAGGLAAYLHADFVHASVRAIAPGLAKFKVTPLSGFFVDHPSVEGLAVYERQMAYVFSMTNASGGVNEACIAATPRNESFRCNFAEQAFQYTTSPIFPLNSAMDAWQMQCIFSPRLPPGFPAQTDPEMNGNCAAVPGWHFCAPHPRWGCSAGQIQQMNDYMSDFKATMASKAAFSRPGNGAFVHSCFTHCEAQNDHDFTTFTVGGYTMQRAVSQWWASDVSAPAIQNTHMEASGCNYSEAWPHHPCNPTCSWS